MRFPFNQRGFTLLEVFAAILVFALGAMALYRLQVATIQSSSFANDLTEATTMAQGKMEELLARDYLDPNLADTDGDGTNQDSDGDGVDDDGGDFGLGHDNPLDSSTQVDFTQQSGRCLLTWNIANDHPFPATKTIRLIVTWRDNKDVPHRTVFNYVVKNPAPDL
jgi:prepilin-type N-terminal cleavage/methylation domain-containing protein